MFSLLEEYLEKKINLLNKQGIKFKVIGNKKLLSKKLIKILLNSEKITIKNKVLHLNLALNYGSKSELVNSVNLIKKKEITLTERNISNNSFF